MAAQIFDFASLTNAAQQAGVAQFGSEGWRPVPERIPSSLTDSNKSTRQTVARMCAHIKDAVTDPKIRSIASRTSGRWGAGLPHQVGWDIFWYEKHSIRFLIDEVPVFGLYGERDNVDFLIAPSVLVRMNPPTGDCDDFTMLACALLECNGVPWEIVTVMSDRKRPGEWSHIYPRAVMPNGRRMVIDATPPGQYPGWEVPAYDIQRKQIWDSNGNPIQDLEPAHESRMHAYRPRGMGQDGSGEVPFEGSALPGGTSIDTSGDTGIFGFPSMAANASTIQAQANAAGTPSWETALINALGQAGTKLGTLALLPSGGTLTTLPNGTQVYTNQATAPSSFNIGGQQIPFTTILLFGGVALVIALALGSHK